MFNSKMIKASDMIAELQGATIGHETLDEKLYAVFEGWQYPLFGAAITSRQHKKAEGEDLNYTTSLNAIIGYIEKYHPEWVWGISQKGTALMYRRAANADGYDVKLTALHHIPEIALCIAVLNVMVAEAGNGFVI